MAADANALLLAWTRAALDRLISPEMGTILPAHFLAIHESQVAFMYVGCGLDGLADPLAREVGVSNPAQFGIYEAVAARLNFPRKIGDQIKGHKCRTVGECGWAGKKKGG